MLIVNYMSKNFQKGYINVLVILILVIGIIAGVYLIQRQTNLFPKAKENPPASIYVPSNGQFGVQIDINYAGKVPNTTQLSALSPRWVRFLYKPEEAIPSFPKNVKTLVIFNHESVPGDSEGKTNFLKWRKTVNWNKFTDEYITALENFIKENQGKINAVEIWNEEDLCNDKSCALVSETVYANMLKRAAAVVKNINPDIKVVMGGLVTDDIYNDDGGYLTKVITADPDAFAQVDAIGLHPYGKPLNNWCTCSSNDKKYYCTDNIDKETGREKCAGVLPWGDLGESIQKYKAVFPSHVKLWITEIGVGTLDDKWREEYMKMVFDYLKDQADVIIWYSWIDTITCGDYGESRCGLYDEHANIKPLGNLFKSYSQP